MRALVLDTNVAAAWYLPEAFQFSARAWQRKMTEGVVELIVPTLHYWEFANVLRTYVKRGELGRDDALEIFEIHSSAPLTTTDPSRDEILKVALEYDSTAYDAVYIALARLLDAQLLTAERTTTPWVVKLGDRAVSVRAD